MTAAAGRFEHGFLSDGVYAETDQVGINIKRFILGVENLTGRSISSLGGSYMLKNGGKSSRQGEFHPKPLTEPYVIVSHHTALVIQIYALFQ